MIPSWLQHVPFAVTVCDKEGIITAMNRKSCEIFARDGGEALIGTNVLDCHPEPSRSKLAHMLANAETNTYTIEKNGVRKLIHQTPFFEDGAYRGFVELSIELPAEMPHFVRG